MKWASFVRRSLAITLSITTFTTNVLLAHVQTGVWAERRNSAPAVSQFPALARPLAALSKQIAKQTPDGLMLPPAYGAVRKVSVPPGVRNGRTIIHIQDVHLNSEAQRNIGRAIEQLIEQKKADLIAVEGAFGPLDIAPFRRFPNQTIIRKVAGYLLHENKIPGSIYTAFTSRNDISAMVGVDDPALYRANVDAYRASAPRAKKRKQALAALENELARKKSSAFNPKLAAFDANVRAYQQGNVSFGQHVRFLADGRPDAPPELAVFLEAWTIESTLNFERVEFERARLIAELVKTLSTSESADLASLSADYRTGNLRHADFYNHLRTLCEKNGIRLSRFPAMETYLRYVRVSDRIDAEKILTEIQTAQTLRYAELARTPQEKDLIAQSRYAFLAGKLIDFSLTPEEWQEYRLHSLSGLDLASFESFYEQAHRRDQAMADNLLQAMEKNHASTGVLVTGGFHSPGINARMNAAGFTTITFVPKISKVDLANGSAYLSAFSQEKTPLEKLFEGEKLFLALPVQPGINEEAILSAVMSGEPIAKLAPALPLKVNAGIVENIETHRRAKIAVEEGAGEDLKVTYQLLGISLISRLRSIAEFIRFDWIRVAWIQTAAGVPIPFSVVFMMGTPGEEEIPYERIVEAIHHLADVHKDHAARNALSHMGSVAVPFLINALNHLSPEVQREAASLLANSKDARTEIPFFEVLQRKESALHDHAVRGLFALEKDKVDQKLVTVLLGDDPRYVNAAHLLHSPEGHVEVDKLIAASKKQMFSASVFPSFISSLFLALIADLINRNPGEAATLLPELLEHPSHNIHIAAAFGFAQLPAEWRKESAVQKLWDLVLAKTDRKGDMGSSAAWALLQIGARQKIAQLVPLLVDGNKNVKRLAQDTLAAMGSEAVPELAQALVGDEDDNRKVALLEVLAKINDERAFEAIFKTLENHDPTLLAITAKTLLNFDRPMILKQKLGEDYVAILNGYIHFREVWAGRSMRDWTSATRFLNEGASSVPALRAALFSGWDELARFAAGLLAQSPAPEAATVLLEKFEEQHQWSDTPHAVSGWQALTIALINALATAKVRKAREPFEKFLNALSLRPTADLSPGTITDIKTALINGLAAIGAKSSAPALFMQSALNNWKVAEAAINALHHLFGEAGSIYIALGLIEKNASDNVRSAALNFIRNGKPTWDLSQIPPTFTRQADVPEELYPSASFVQYVVKTAGQISKLNVSLWRENKEDEKKDLAGAATFKQYLNLLIDPAFFQFPQKEKLLQELDRLIPLYGFKLEKLYQILPLLLNPTLKQTSLYFFENAGDALSLYFQNASARSPFFNALLADAFALIGPSVGSNIEGLLIAASQEGVDILSPQEKNRILMAQLARTINPDAKLPQGQMRAVYYRVLGFRSDHSQAERPYVTITWLNEYDANFSFHAGRYQENPPEGAFGFRRAILTDEKGAKHPILGYLGQETETEDKSKFTPDPSHDLSHFKSEKHEIYMVGNIRHQRPQKLVRRTDGSVFHIVLIGLQTDLSLAYYEIVETGAVFTACINATLLRERVAKLREEDRGKKLDHLDLEDLETASNTMLDFLTNLRADLKDPEHRIPGFDPARHFGAPDEKKEILQAANYLATEFPSLFAQLIPERKKWRDLSVFERVEVFNDAWMRLLSENRPLAEELDRRFKLGALTYAVPFSFARFSHEGLLKVAEHINAKAGVELKLQTGSQLAQLMSGIYNRYRGEALLLSNLAKMFSYNATTWAMMAVESLTVGHGFPGQGVDHYSVFQVLESVSRPKIKPDSVKKSPYVTVRIPFDLSEKIGLQGRTAFLSEGATVKNALQTIRLNDFNGLRYSVDENPVTLERELKENDTLRIQGAWGLWARLRVNKILGTKWLGNIEGWILLGAFAGLFYKLMPQGPPAIGHEFLLPFLSTALLIFVGLVFIDFLIHLATGTLGADARLKKPASFDQRIRNAAESTAISSWSHVGIPLIAPAMFLHGGIFWVLLIAAMAFGGYVHGFKNQQNGRRLQPDATWSERTGLMIAKSASPHMRRYLMERRNVLEPHIDRLAKEVDRSLKLALHVSVSGNLELTLPDSSVSFQDDEGTVHLPADYFIPLFDPEMQHHLAVEAVLAARSPKKSRLYTLQQHTWRLFFESDVFALTARKEWGAQVRPQDIIPLLESLSHFESLWRIILRDPRGPNNVKELTLQLLGTRLTVGALSDPEKLLAFLKSWFQPPMALALRDYIKYGSAKNIEALTTDDFRIATRQLEVMKQFGGFQQLLALDMLDIIATLRSPASSDHWAILFKFQQRHPSQAEFLEELMRKNDVTLIQTNERHLNPLLSLLEHDTHFPDNTIVSFPTLKRKGQLLNEQGRIHVFPAFKLGILERIASGEDLRRLFEKYLQDLKEYAAQTGAKKIVLVQILPWQGLLESAGHFQKPARNTPDLFQAMLRSDAFFGPHVTTAVHVVHGENDQFSPLYKVFAEWTHGSFGAPVNSLIADLPITAFQHAGETYVFGNFENVFFTLTKPPSDGDDSDPEPVPDPVDNIHSQLNILPVLWSVSVGSAPFWPAPMALGAGLAFWFIFSQPYSFTRSLRVVVKEFRYQLPVFLLVYFVPSIFSSSPTFLLAAILNGVLGAVFARNHELSAWQTLFLSLVGFSFGAVFLWPGLVENHGAWTILAAMGAHFIYIHLVAAVKWLAKRTYIKNKFPRFVRFAEFLPQATIPEDVIEHVQKWLERGDINFQNVPRETVLKLIDPATRKQAMNELIKTQTENPKKRKERLAKYLPQLEAIAGKPVSPSRITYLPQEDVDKWIHIFTEEFNRTMKTGTKVYPVDAVAVKEYLAIFTMLSHYMRRVDSGLFITGFSVDLTEENPSKRKAPPRFAGVPQEIIEARLLRVNGQPFPFYRGWGKFNLLENAVIPFVGGFYRADGSPITDQELHEAGLEWVKDETGQDLTWPVFASARVPTRVLTLPLPMPRLIVILGDGKFRPLLTAQDFEEFIMEKFGPEPFEEIKRSAIEKMNALLDSFDPPPSDAYRQEALQYAYTGEMTDFLKGKGHKVAIPIIALRYKGIGGRYVLTPLFDEDAQKLINSGDQIFTRKKTMFADHPGITFTEDSRLAGKSGVFLTPYHPEGTTAMNGESKEVLVTPERDRTLFANGAQLSTLNLAAMPLVSGETLKKWGAPDSLAPLHVSLQVVTDDTRNLVEALQFFDLFITSEFGPNPKKGKDYFLSAFTQSFGNNMAAIIKSGLTIAPNDIGIQRNVSPLGNLRDTEELQPMKIPHEMLLIVKAMFDAGFYVAERAGMTYREWIGSEYFDSLIKSFVEAFEGDKKGSKKIIGDIKNLQDLVLAQAKKLQTKDKEIYGIVWLAAPLLFEYCLKVKGVKITEKDGRDFLEITKKFPKLEGLAFGLKTMKEVQAEPGTALATAGTYRLAERVLRKRGWTPSSRFYGFARAFVAEIMLAFHVESGRVYRVGLDKFKRAHGPDQTTWQKTTRSGGLVFFFLCQALLPFSMWAFSLTARRGRAPPWQVRIAAVPARLAEMAAHLFYNSISFSARIGSYRLLAPLTSSNDSLVNINEIRFETRSSFGRLAQALLAYLSHAGSRSVINLEKIKNLFFKYETVEDARRLAGYLRQEIENQTDGRRMSPGLKSIHEKLQKLTGTVQAAVPARIEINRIDLPLSIEEDDLLKRAADKENAKFLNIRRVKDLYDLSTLFQARGFIRKIIAKVDEGTKRKSAALELYVAVEKLKTLRNQPVPVGIIDILWSGLSDGAYFWLDSVAEGQPATLKEIAELTRVPKEKLPDAIRGIYNEVMKTAENFPDEQLASALAQLKELGYRPPLTESRSRKRQLLHDILIRMIEDNIKPNDSTALSNDLDHFIRPSRLMSREKRAFDAAIHSARRDVRNRFKNFGDALTAAFHDNANAPALIFVNNRKDFSFVEDALRKKPRFALIVLSSKLELSRDVKWKLEKIEKEYEGDIPLAYRTANRDFFRSGEGFSLEEMFASFKSAFANNAEIYNALEKLAGGEAPIGTRIVQANEPDEPYIGSRALLDLMIGVTGPVLLDYRAILKAAGMA